jgi:hypothetical protein
MHQHAFGALVGQHAQVGRCEHRASWCHHSADGNVAAGMAYEVAGLETSLNGHSASIGGNFGLFDHADGVRT